MKQFMEVLVVALPITLNVLYWVVVATIVVHSFIAFRVIDRWGGVPRHLEWKILFHQGTLVLMATVVMSSLVWWNPQQVPLPLAALLVQLGLWPIVNVSLVHERLERARQLDLVARRMHNRFRP